MKKLSLNKFILIPIIIISLILGYFLFHINKINSQFINCESTSQDQIFLKNNNNVLFFKKGSGIYDINLKNRSCKLKKVFTSDFKQAYKLDNDNLLINSNEKSVIYNVKTNNTKDIEVINGGNNFQIENKMIFVSAHKVQILNLKTYKVKTLINIKDEEEFKFSKSRKFKDGKLFLVTEKTLPITDLEKQKAQKTNKLYELKKEKQRYDFYLLDPAIEKVKKVYENYKFMNQYQSDLNFLTLNKNQKVFFTEYHNNKVIIMLFDPNKGTFDTIIPPEVLKGNYFNNLIMGSNEDLNFNILNLADNNILFIVNNYLYLYNPIKNKLLVELKYDSDSKNKSRRLLVRLKDGNILILSNKSYLFNPKQKKIIATVNTEIKFRQDILNAFKLNNGNILLTWDKDWDNLNNSRIIIIYDYKKQKFYQGKKLLSKRYDASNIQLNEDYVLFYAGKSIYNDSNVEQAPEKPEIYSIQE